jgi:hypothetical protein
MSRLVVNSPLIATTSSDFKWGSTNGADFIKFVEKAYEKVAFFKRNIFMVPSGKVGKQFVLAKAKLYESFTQGHACEGIAHKALAIMEHLLLQKVNVKSRSKDHVKTLSRRLELWQKGDVPSLLEEAVFLQKRLPEKRSKLSDDKVARIFSKLMFEGRTRDAIKFLDTHGDRGGILPLTAEVRKKLNSLHPIAKPADPAALIEGTPPKVHITIFQELTGNEIKEAANRTRGAAGISGGDAHLWSRMLWSFGDASMRLCDAMATFAKRLCTEYLDPSSLEAFLANRLIPLNKDPGVRPVGIGEIPRRIIGKAIMQILKKDIMEAVGSTQQCAGQKGGIEAIVHAMIKMFSSMESEALLLVDASNAFNSLNRAVALHNIRFICPLISITLINCYRTAARLFVQGGLELSSSEGTTQGDPLAMAMYGLGLMPLVDLLREEKTKSRVQAWYADDGQALGKLQSLFTWLNLVKKFGPRYGYYLKAKKTYLIVKPQFLEKAKSLFQKTGIKVVGDGHRDLGSIIGSRVFVEKELTKKVKYWSRQIEQLSKIARTQPHAAHAGFVHGIKGRWTYIQRTMKSVQPLMKPLETEIREKFIPALLDLEPQDISVNLRNLLALPARYGGLGINNPVVEATFKHSDSLKLTSQLQDNILSSEKKLNIDEVKQKQAIKEIRKSRAKRYSLEYKKIRQNMSKMQQRAMDLAAEKGASCLYTTRPLQDHNFVLKSKRDWRDWTRLRYNLPIQGLAPYCACGKPNNIRHSQKCLKGGLIHKRHDELRDLWASLCQEVHRDIEIEPQLLQLTGEKFEFKTANREDDARTDVRVRDFYGNKQNAFFEMRVFDPSASSYAHRSLSALFKTFEKTRSRQYEHRINLVDNGNFTPMIMATNGVMGPRMTVAFKHLAWQIAGKRSELYSQVAGVLRCKFSFAMIRSTLRCLRGSRHWSSNKKNGSLTFPAALVVSEAGINTWTQRGVVH